MRLSLDNLPQWSNWQWNLTPFQQLGRSSQIKPSNMNTSPSSRKLNCWPTRTMDQNPPVNDPRPVTRENALEKVLALSVSQAHEIWHAMQLIATNGSL